MKKTIVLLFITLSFLFASCNSASYRSDLSCNDISNAILSDTSKEFIEYESYYTDYIISDQALYNDCTVIYSLEVNDIDEIGIFRATDKESANIIRQELTVYIDGMRQTERAFIESYAKDELPKLDAARVESLGLYVIYVISDTDSVNKIITATEKVLS
jgi:hypothetical protein